MGSPASEREHADLHDTLGDESVRGRQPMGSYEFRGVTATKGKSLVQFSKVVSSKMCSRKEHSEVFYVHHIVKVAA